MDKNQNVSQEKEMVVLKNVTVELHKGISKKTNQPYSYLRINTGDFELNGEIKAVFLKPLATRELELRG